MVDSDLFSQLIVEKFGRKTLLKVPLRGDNVRLIDLACKNAKEEAERVTERDDRMSATVTMLGKMLSIEPPERIESFDISNISGTDIVASMVVFLNGKPKKSEYKRFKIRDLNGQDDYGAMEQTVSRRFADYNDQTAGFTELPDLVLIDGGAAHAKIAQTVLQKYELSVPVLGMVKDDRHRTRALITPDNKEIRIDNQQYVYSLIGTIQEETHRFAIGYHRKLRSKRLRYSELDTIPGIGNKRKQELLKVYKSLRGIAEAELWELERYLPKNAALAVYEHFRKGDNK
jgi:excinuclease ABC subunit C